jgi:hypothetical protein
MQVRVVAEQITEGLDDDDSAGQRIVMFRAESEIGLKTLTTAAAQIGKPLAGIHLSTHRGKNC